MGLGHKKGCFGPSDQGWSKMGEAGPSLALPPGRTALGYRPLWCSLDEWEVTEVNPQWEWGAWWSARPPAVGNERKTERSG